ncbi:MAG: hypothetical protein Q4G58_15130 [bacterium]|nr:hypothetical protein [bacterium]
MRRKNVNKLLAAILAVIMLMCCACSTKKDKETRSYNDKPNEKIASNLNYLGGVGAIKVNEYGTIYDDSGVYIKPTVSSLLYRIDENGEASVACGDVTCTHSDTKCNAYSSVGSNSNYFIFNDELYMGYNEVNISSDGTSDTTGKILRIDGNERKEVFTNSVPDDMDSELRAEATKEISETKTYNSNYILLIGDTHNYILNQNFEIIYCFMDLGKVCKALIVGDRLYYINNLFELVEVDLRSKKQSIIVEHKKEKISDFAIDESEKMLYYATFDAKIYKRKLSEVKSAGEYLFKGSFLMDLYGDTLYAGKKIYNIKTGEIRDCDEFLESSYGYAVTKNAQYMIMGGEEEGTEEKLTVYIMKNGKIIQKKEIQ